MIRAIRYRYSRTRTASSLLLLAIFLYKVAICGLLCSYLPFAASADSGCCSNSSALMLDEELPPAAASDCCNTGLRNGDDFLLQNIEQLLNHTPTIANLLAIIDATDQCLQPQFALNLHDDRYQKATLHRCWLAMPQAPPLRLS